MTPSTDPGIVADDRAFEDDNDKPHEKKVHEEKVHEDKDHDEKHDDDDDARRRTTEEPDPTRATMTRPTEEPVRGRRPAVAR